MAPEGQEDCPIELTYNWDGDDGLPSDGRHFGHLAYGVENIYEMCQNLQDAGITINAELLGALFAPLALGIILGLTLGKPIGIFLATWLGVKLKIGALPKGVTWQHILGAGVLAGMGFTMSIFIATLAFSTGGGHAELLGFRLASPAALAAADMEDIRNLAKLAILIASTLAGVVGYAILRLAPESKVETEKVTPPERS